LDKICKDCKWFRSELELKKLFNSVWDLKKYDGMCMFEPQVFFKFEKDFCSHYEEKDEINNKD